MSKVKCVLAFILGAGVGSVVTWKLLSDKYEKLVQEEVASVKEHLGARVKGTTEDADLPFEYDEEAEDVDSDYPRLTREYGQTEQHDLRRPYVIHPTQFGMHSTYGTRSLKCFADRVVTDDDENVIEDVDNIVGDESLDHFGEYEMDSVYVRNDRLKCDYEILLDVRRYSDRNKEAHLTED